MKSVMFLLCALLSLNVAKSQTTERFIEVTGSSEKRITPDEVEIMITVSETDNIKKGSELDDREKKILGALREFSIPESDIATEKLGGSNNGYYSYSRKYEIDKTYQVAIKNIKIIDDLVVKLFEAGANSVRITKLSNVNIEKYRNEAAQEAVQRARDRAESIARTLNVSIGKAIVIQELTPLQPFLSNRNQPGIARRELNYVENRDAALDLKKIIITYDVAIRFEVK
jgi:uncharacterized protein